MDLSLASKKRRSVESEEKENRNERTDDRAKKMKVTTADQSKIRDQIVEEFRKRSLEIPFQMIGKNLNDYLSHHNSCRLFSHCRCTRSSRNE